MFKQLSGSITMQLLFFNQQCWRYYRQLVMKVRKSDTPDIEQASLADKSKLLHENLVGVSRKINPTAEI